MAPQVDTVTIVLLVNCSHNINGNIKTHAFHETLVKMIRRCNSNVMKYAIDPPRHQDLVRR